MWRSRLVTDTNTGARRLYERNGFRKVGRRKTVKENWVHPGKDWLLLTKHLAGEVKAG